MLVTFKSKAHADILMFGDVAIKLLKLMGQSGNVPGAIDEEGVGQAHDTLSTALERMRNQAAQNGAAPAGEGRSGDEDAEPPVPLHTRAVPLLDMLQAASAEHVAVMWE